MTLEESLSEYDNLTKESYWGLEIYIYPYNTGPFIGFNRAQTDRLYPWKYHIRASYSISSGGAGLFYRTDDLVQGINHLITYLEALPSLDWNIMRRIDLGTPINPSETVL